MPIVRSTTDAETSHRLAVRLLGMGKWARPVDKGKDEPSLECKVNTSLTHMSRVVEG